VQLNNGVVGDPDGGLWVVPSDVDAWENRRSFEWADDTDLEPIPGHYKYLLNLPF
jgi:hypothetical protein